ncbi:hypothetical protein [Streptomyces sp. NBC_00280]|uniref:hypothetical protein n=1 Tax=Streptomyces sp. NBC_00280 TaxID=2975699 RepID=UPI0032511E10
MSTRLVPTAACIGTFVLLMHLTTTGVAPPHRATLPHTGLSHIQWVVGDVAPVPAALLVKVCGRAVPRGVAAAQ